MADWDQIAEGDSDVLDEIDIDVVYDENYDYRDDEEEEEEPQASEIDDSLSKIVLNDNWESHFPMPSFRKYQRETIQQIIAAWKSGKRYVIVEGTTGSGKSAFSLTLGRLFGDAFLATPQKMLQNQYMHDFPDHLFELKGRANYPCLRLNFANDWCLPSDDKKKRAKDLEEEDTTSKKKSKKQEREKIVPAVGYDYITLDQFRELPPDHPQRQYNCGFAPCLSSAQGARMKQECRNYGVCEYITRREFALRAAPFTLMNFSNLLLFSLLMGKDDLDKKPYRTRPLLILDECHTLESFLYEYASLSVTTTHIKRLQSYIPLEGVARITEPFTMAEFIEYAEKVILPASKAYEDWAKSESDKNIFESDVTTRPEDKATMKANTAREAIKELAVKLRLFIKQEPTDHSHVIIPEMRDDEEDVSADLNKSKKKIRVGIKIKPFSVAYLGEKLAFKSSHSKVLLMSATILDPKTFCKSVGIPPEKAFFLRVPSTFPVESRLIIGHESVGSMSYYTKDKTMPKMLEKILELSEKHSDHKGIIHTGNYENMWELIKWAKWNARDLHGRLLCPSKGTFEQKDSLLKHHFATEGEPTILCGPGFIEGLDLKNDFARFNIMMKLPFMSLADPLIKRKSEEFPEWYALQTALSIIQALGRGNRSETDWCVNYILDLMWKKFYFENKRVLIPQYIQDAIRWCSDQHPIPHK
jgi:Rad3-related DNA helicase